MAPLLIEVILISDRVNEKINSLHGLSCNDVEDAADQRLATRWGFNDQGVWRLLLIGQTTYGMKVKMALYPAGEPGVWRLGTAYPVR